MTDGPSERFQGGQHILRVRSPVWDLYLGVCSCKPASASLAVLHLGLIALDHRRAVKMGRKGKHVETGKRDQVTPAKRSSSTITPFISFGPKVSANCSKILGQKHLSRSGQLLNRSAAHNYSNKKTNLGLQWFTCVYKLGLCPGWVLKFEISDFGPLELPGLLFQRFKLHRLDLNKSNVIPRVSV